MSAKGHAIPHLTNPKKRDCFNWYMAGWTAEELEKQFDIPANRIRQWVHRDKWNDQKAEFEAALEKKHPAKEQLPIVAVMKNKKGEIREKFIEKAGKIAEQDIEHWAENMTPEDRLGSAQSIAALNGVHRKNLELDMEAETKERGHITLTFLNNPEVKLIEPEKVKTIEDAQ